MTGMSPEFLRAIEGLRAGFIEEAEPRLQRIRALRMQVQGEPENQAAFDGFLSEVHKLRGISRPFGFESLGDLAQQVEDSLTDPEAPPSLSERMDRHAELIDQLIAELGQVARS